MGLTRLATGQLVEVTNLKPEQIRAWDFGWAIGMIVRNGGHLPVSWTVLDHTGLVFLLGMQNTKGQLNPVDRLAIMLHDTAEAYTGDLLGPNRDDFPWKDVHALEQHILKDLILPRFGLNPDLIDWEVVDKYDKQAFFVESMLLTPDLKGSVKPPVEIYPITNFPHLAKIAPRDYVEQLRSLTIEVATAANRSIDVHGLFELPDHLRKYAYPDEGTPSKKTSGGNHDLSGVSDQAGDEATLNRGI